jgi:hypothetical protein
MQRQAVNVAVNPAVRAVKAVGVVAKAPCPQRLARAALALAQDVAAASRPANDPFRPFRP